MFYPILYPHDRPPFTAIGLRAFSDGFAVSGGAFASGECVAQEACYGASFA